MEIGSVADTNDMVTNISFGLPMLWSEIFYLDSRESIENLRRIVSSESYKNRLIFESLNELNRGKFNLRQVVTSHKAVKIDNIKTYHKVREIYESPGSQLFLRTFN